MRDRPPAVLCAHDYPAEFAKRWDQLMDELGELRREHDGWIEWAQDVTGQWMTETEDARDAIAQIVADVPAIIDDARAAGRKDAEADRRAADPCGWPEGTVHPHVEQCHRAERERAAAEVEALADLFGCWCPPPSPHPGDVTQCQTCCFRALVERLRTPGGEDR